MASWDGMDRRKFPRANYPCLVVLRRKDEEKEVILTHTENVGVGGICVILKKDVKIFCPVELELDLLDLGKHIVCRGKIVWNVQRKDNETKKPLFYDIGIEFADIEHGDQSRLEEIVRRLEQNQQETADS